jgi:hypothetical protein
MNRRDFLRQAAVVSLGGAMCSGCAKGSAETMMRGLVAGDSIAWQCVEGMREGLSDAAVIDSIATPGNTSAQLDAQLQALDAEGKHWDFIVLNGAWNDLRKSALTPFQHWQSVQRVIDAAERLADHWYWVSTTPIREEGEEALRHSVNDAAVGFCTRRNGVYVPGGEFVVALGENVHLPDGLHLSWETAEVLGEFIALEIGGRIQEMAGGERAAAAVQTVHRAPSAARAERERIVRAAQAILLAPSDGALA